MPDNKHKKIKAIKLISKVVSEF